MGACPRILAFPFVEERQWERHRVGQICLTGFCQPDILRRKRSRLSIVKIASPNRFPAVPYYLAEVAEC